MNNSFADFANADNNLDNNIDYFEELSIWNPHSIFNYIKHYYIQLLLLCFVFVIVYVIEHVTNINAMIFSMPSVIPALQTTLQQSGLPLQQSSFISKKNKSKQAKTH
jgi:hypothetical protein